MMIVWMVFSTHALYASTLELSVNLFGRSFTQPNLGDVLTVSGYRTINCSSASTPSGCTVEGAAGLGVRYPDVSLSAAFRWNKRLALSATLGLPRLTEVTYGYYTAVDPLDDKLMIGARVHTLDLVTDFHLLPYPREKKIGCDIIASGGLSFIRLKETLEAEVPDTLDSTLPLSQTSVSGGLNALFALQVRLYLNKRFYLIPTHLHWTLPVLRPSFSESDFDSTTRHRFLLGRNYDFKGLWLTLGAGLSF
ncbi:MAG: hypothetical protein ACKOKF_06240 [Bacteroidota bacterium]